jgi:SAM-dependent methyltransferase
MVHLSGLSNADLERALAGAKRPDLLKILVDTSRESFGFSTKHFPHVINYPWVAARLEDLPARSHILDVGAGVSPIPVWLAQRGMEVNCVDSHPVVRSLPATDDWNEWGFFDYGQLHPNLTSHHCSIAEFTPLTTFDAIYSICVLAHMQRTVREDTLRRCREWLRPGGRLLLTIDLIPATDFLWNRSEGTDVESLLVHGAVADVLLQLGELGFRLNESSILRTIYNSRTDLLLIHCTR